jgi:hypothetical protein
MKIGRTQGPFQSTLQGRRQQHERSPSHPETEGLPCWRKWEPGRVSLEADAAKSRAPRLLTRLISRNLESVMDNSKLRWVRPQYVFGSDEAEKPARAAKRKATKSEPFVDDGILDTFTVAQIASLWQLSTDTIQRWLEDEPGVIASGDKNPRGKRKRVTLRIPRAVMERVKRRMANK